MKIPKYISPTSLRLWETDREEFFLKYLTDFKHPDSEQTLAMAAGSAFDAYVKSSLHKHVFGNYGDKYSLDQLLETQVDASIISEAREAGAYIFDRYGRCGAYGELLDLLCRSDEDPRFEFTLFGEVYGVPLIGKPDCWFVHKGTHVVLDWKVSGFCSSSPTSPKKLYANCRDTWTAEEGKPTRGGDGPHKSYDPMDIDGITIGSHWLDDVDKSWSDQLSIYTWMLGSPVGSQNVVTCIDQIVAKPAEPKPLLRVAQHRCRISAFWQLSLSNRLVDCWNTINSGHIFPELTREESDSRCEVLLMQVESFDNGVDPLWAEVNKKVYRG